MRRHERAFIRFILFYRIRAFQRKPEDSRGFGTILRNMKRAQSYGKQVNPLESCPRMNQRIMGPKNFLSLHKVGKLHNTSDVPKPSLRPCEYSHPERGRKQMGREKYLHFPEQGDRYRGAHALHIPNEYGIPISIQSRGKMY